MPRSDHRGAQVAGDVIDDCEGVLAPLRGAETGDQHGQWRVVSAGPF